MKTALSIAGSDPSGGAGLQADLKVFQKHNIHGLSIATSLTAQSITGVEAIEEVSVEFFEKQLHTLLKEIRPDAIKTGMLYKASHIEVIKDAFTRYKLDNLVIDPVIKSSSGKMLIEKDGITALKKELFPIAKIITPNIQESSIFSGITLKTREDMHEAAKKLYETGAEGIVITGGHLNEFISSNSDLHKELKIKKDFLFDLFYDGNNYHELGSELYPGKYHGTGCTFSASITANLVLGYSLLDSVKRAKDFIKNAIKNAYKLGGGMSILSV